MKNKLLKILLITIFLVLTFSVINISFADNIGVYNTNNLWDYLVYAKNLSLVINIFIIIALLYVKAFKNYNWKTIGVNIILFVIRIHADILCYISIPSGGAFNKIDDSNYIYSFNNKKI